MRLSLVICSRNRARQLDATLRHILTLKSADPWDLVIVDNGSTDETQAVIQGFRSQFTHELATCFEPRAGLGHARNRGWTIAKGDIVAFTDDDCYPAQDFLISVGRAFEEDVRLGFVGGRLLLYDQTDCAVAIQESTSRRELGPRTFIPAGLIPGANFACRRQALESVGGFDGRFGPDDKFKGEINGTSGEDVRSRLVWRIRSAPCRLPPPRAEDRRRGRAAERAVRPRTRSVLCQVSSDSGDSPDVLKSMVGTNATTAAGDNAEGTDGCR